MRKPKTLEETYNLCVADGYINENRDVNIDKIRSLLENAETNVNTASLIIKAINRQAREWMSVYTFYYEALRIYAEALLLADKVNISNHQCLFAYLCVKHPELELDWGFFEKVRTKRNGINYYGEHICYEDWKSIELQIKLYLGTLKKEIEKII